MPQKYSQNSKSVENNLTDLNLMQDCRVGMGELIPWYKIIAKQKHYCFDCINVEHYLKCVQTYTIHINTAKLHNKYSHDTAFTIVVSSNNYTSIIQK